MLDQIKLNIDQMGEIFIPLSYGYWRPVTETWIMDIAF